MNKKILITVIHDFFIFCFSFFIALLLRLESDYAIFLMESLWVFSILFAIINIVINIIKLILTKKAKLLLQ